MSIIRIKLAHVIAKTQKILRARQLVGEYIHPVTVQTKVLSKPLEISTEILDNSLVILTAIEDVCEILEIDPYQTGIYSDYERADLKYGKAILYSPPQSSGHPDRYNEELMWQWFSQLELPVDFRLDFIRHFLQRDQISDKIATLSQSRWERLRFWIHDHA